MIPKTLIYASILSTLIPILIFVFLVKNRSNFSLKILVLYLLISFITDALSFFHLYSKNNNHLIGAFVIFELLILLGFIFHENNLISSKYAGVYLVICLIIYFLFVSNIDFEIGPYIIYISIIKSGVLIAFCLRNFFKLINDLTNPRIIENYYFWINAAILIYFSSVLFIFLFMKYILDPNAAASIKSLWLVHNSFHIIYNILLSIAFLKWKEEKK